jgi:isopenicillin N synthase-like dioxygenase
MCHHVSLETPSLYSQASIHMAIDSDCEVWSMSCSCRRSRTRSDPRLRRHDEHAAVEGVPLVPSSGHGLQRVPLAALDTPAAQAALLTALCRDGLAILTLDKLDVNKHVQRCYAACQRFFMLPFNAKVAHSAGPGPGQAHGWMEYLDEDEGSECFEAKLHYDKRFAWPEQAGFERAVVGLLQLLLQAAHRALFALTDALEIERELATALLDDTAQSSATDFERCSHTAMRVWSYTRGRPTGWHCDNSLLTLAPSGSSVGLRVRLTSGALCEPEREMKPGELIVFAGDALGYMSRGRVPALMHEVVPPRTGDGPSAAPRLSAPFFLRGRHDAHLTPPPPLPPLSIRALERNVGNLRSHWPWKQTGPLRTYYDDQQWHAAEG